MWLTALMFVSIVVWCHHSGMSHIKTEKSSKWWFQRTRGNKHKEWDGEGTRTATDRRGQQFRPTSRSTQLQNQKFKIKVYSEKDSMITHHYQTQFYTTKNALFYSNYCTSTIQVNVMPYNQLGNHLKPTQYHTATALKE